MKHCSECNFPLEQELTICPQCGAEVKLTSPGEQTVHASADSDVQPVDISDTVNLSSPATEDASRTDLESEAPSLDESSSNSSPGSGTVSAPGVGSGFPAAAGQAASADDWDEDADIDQTVDASMTELDEADDFDFDDSLPGVQSDVFNEMGDAAFGEERGTVISGGEDFPNVFASPDADNQRTVNAFGMPDDNNADDPHATHVDASDESNEPLAGQMTIDMASEDRPTYHAAMGHATVDSSNDESQTREEEVSDDDGVDDAARTVVFPGNASAAPGTDKTIVFDSHQAASSTVEASGTTGTEGRLKRLWEGVAGSSENPMHSLQAVGLQASDSVFQRVATRRVADASTSSDVSADYQIVDKLGEGAMGIVFSARQTAVNRIVAIKTAKPSFQNNDESRRRFLYEAHITADLDHSNIVPIHELGASEEGMLFYSMKLVQGTEWSRVMRKKTREQNLEIFMKVTDAMAFAHSKGVIHRDLKPENTMLGRFGEVFVTDWGTAINLDKDTTHLAKPAAKGDKFLTLEDASSFVRGDSLVLHDGFDTYDRAQIVNFDEANPNRIYLRKKLTRDYQPSRRLYVVKAMNLAGTPCYMAPEMAGHQLPKIAKTSDIYILGAILYDLVTGKPPHTGDSVTQCLRAALKNEIIRTDNEDALLAIAYKAMATEPAERYQSVEELQEAVREYSRHAESIALSDRSDELLQTAIVKKDYESFSRTMFGYRDAIELWPDNKAAALGLKQARLAFGKAAFAKADYDLVLQTLDREEADEAQLYSQAVKAKKKFEEREATLKLLKRVVAAVVLLAVVGLSGLTWFANSQKNIAVAARTKAEESAEQERKAKLQEAESRALAETSAQQARDAQVVAENERVKADKAREQAENAAVAEAKQREIAVKNEIEAKLQSELAQMKTLEAQQQTELANRRSAQIQLGEHNSLLALAKSQIESFDLAAGTENLGKLRSMFASAAEQLAPDQISNDVFFGNAPRIDTWGWQRIQLLGNLDLPTATVTAAADPNSANIDSQVAESQITATAFAPTSGLAVVGTAQGLVQVLQYEAGELRKSRSLLESGARIDALAISPDGQEVVYAFTQGDVSGVKRWEVAQDTAQEVISTQKRSFQRFAYTPGGKQLVGGISGGIWLWDLTENWYQRENPTERISIRGELTNLQGLDSQHSLLTTRFVERGQSKVLIAILDHQSKAIDLVKTSDDLASRLSSAAHTLVDNRIVLGLSNNRVMVGTLDPSTREITNLLELEDKHRAPVTHVVSNGSNQLLTASDSEPVAHVWRFDPQLQAWEYDTYLTGTPRNIAGVGLLGERILAVDAGGTSIVWDVQRQKQRRRLERLTDNEFVEYIAPVQAVIAGPSDGHAIAIDSQGVVDLWSLSNGQTSRLDNARWSYFGHTPGAQLVNSAVDLERGVVVTAASLQNALRQYLVQPDHAWEFCVWNANSGQMLRRWTAPNRRVDERTETIEQRISLVDSGRQILFASDSETRLVELNTGLETFLRNDFGSYFAVPNPRNPELLMLVKRSGAVRLLDLREPTSWENAGMRNFGLADPSDIPLDGIWSEDGKQFYLTFSTGSLAAFHWNGTQLELSWSSRKLNGVPGAERINQALQTDSGRVQSHLDVDLAVQTQPAGHTLYIATRRRGLHPTTQLSVLRFADQQPTPNLVLSEKRPQVQWLQSAGAETPQLTTRLHDVLVVDANRVRSRQRVNDQTFVSTQSAQVLGLTDGEPEVMSYGRSRLVSTTGTQDGTRMMVLLEDGALWQFTAEGADGQWSRMDYSALGANRILLSPMGDQLLIVQPTGGTLVETQSGREIAQLGELTAATWDPGAAHRLAVGRPNGSLDLIAEGIVQRVAEKPLLGEGATWASLHFFSEVWADSNKQTRQFLVVHSEADNKGALQFVPLSPAPANAADAQPELEVIPIGSRVAVSPTDNIIVTGAPGGTVSVWFAAPTHDRKPRQLFDLEGHRGEDITCLTFSSDGRTIVTADSKNRLYAWLSQDPLVRK
jgi:serine/threonine protein kinase/WD40 repeat protein